MSERPSPPATVTADSGPGKVWVAVADSERPPVTRVARLVRLGLIAFTAIVAAAGVLTAARWIGGTAAAPRATGTPATVLDAHAVAPGAAPAVSGSTRLDLVGPLMLVDTRATGTLSSGALAPREEITLPVPGLPPGTSAVLVEVSLLEATGPGAVTVASAAGTVEALQVPQAKAQASATVVVPVGADGKLRVRSDGGGHLMVNLVGMFQPAAASTSGRIVSVPNARILRLVPASSGKIATIDLAAVPALAGAGPVSAVLLQISADVGGDGGSVEASGFADRFDQHVYWAATAGDDRTRTGFLVVPAASGSVRMQYQAGNLLTVDLVGYVTGATAPQATAGLIVPVRTAPGQPGPGQPVQVPAGTPTNVTVIATGGAVPADRVAAVLIGVMATASAPGGVALYPPDAAPPADATLFAASGPPRSALALVRAVGGAVRVASTAGATVSLTPQAVILNGP